MQRVLSTYLFVKRKLTAGLLEAAARAGFGEIEIFCSRSHFDYSTTQQVRELAGWLEVHGLTLHSLHAPTERDSGGSRESGLPLSISDPERSRRQEAVDEVKRALDVAEIVPFRYLVQHVCSSRDAMDPRQWDAAFSSLEHLMIFAKQRGVTVALENTPNEMATPSKLRHFIEETRLQHLRLCFDAGHAHMQDGVAAGFEAMSDLVVTTHIHDNHGEKDEHLPPFEGTVDWTAAGKIIGNGLPLVLELKEHSADPRTQEPSPAAGLLQSARTALDRLEGVRAAKQKAN
jgi:sugar phosphate isomerase/epimerase